MVHGSINFITSRQQPLHKGSILEVRALLKGPSVVMMRVTTRCISQHPVLLSGSLPVTNCCDSVAECSTVPLSIFITPLGGADICRWQGSLTVACLWPELCMQLRKIKMSQEIKEDRVNIITGNLFHTIFVHMYNVVIATT